jgi:hypothetical protein
LVAHVPVALAAPMSAVAAAFLPPLLMLSRPVLDAAQVPASDVQEPSAPSRSANPSMPHVPVHDAFWTARSFVAALPPLAGGPVVSPRQAPPVDRHAIVAPSLVARVLCPPSPLPSS